MVCSEFNRRAFLHLTHGDAWTPPLGEGADESNAAALAAAPDAGDSTVRPVDHANATASRPFTAAAPGVEGTLPDPGDAAAPAHAEAADAGDSAAPGAPPAAAAAIASAAAVAATEVPNIDGAVVVERDGRRD